MNEEIKVEASEGRRRLTLEPMLPVVPMEVEPRRVESLIPCGFRANWLTGEDAGVTFELCSGAGFGNKWLTLEVTMPDGTRRKECIDMEKVTETWVTRIVEAES